MIKVNVEIDYKSWQIKIKNPKKYFNQKLKKISNTLKPFKKKNITFTILLTNDSKIKELNKKFRKKNKPTDVLSFPYFYPKDLKLLKEKKIYIGDIAVSYKAILQKSQNYIFVIVENRGGRHPLIA